MNKANIEIKSQSDVLPVNDYEPSHCWYYKLGGQILFIKSILAEVRRDKCKGAYRNDIDKADRHADRVEKLNLLFVNFKAKLLKDISIYRKYRLKLIRERRLGRGVDIHLCMSISLKHNHVYCNLAHLVFIDSLLNKKGSQIDLFGF